MKCTMKRRMLSLWFSLFLLGGAKIQGNVTFGQGGESAIETSKSRFGSRLLRQTASETADAGCTLSDFGQRRFFDLEQNSWRVTNELVGELGGDLQPVVDCAAGTEATIRIASDVRIEVATPIDVSTSIRIVGERNNGSIPALTCAGNRIIQVRNSTDVLLRNLRFEGCAPRRRGSPVEIKESEVTVRDCRFEGNRAVRGGAISVLAGSSLTLRDSSFINNTASRMGGAIYLFDDTQLVVEDVTFLRNSAAQGGAIYLEAAAAPIEEISAGPNVNLEMRSSQCSSNQATLGGCIAAFNNSRLLIRDSQVAGNSADGGGGGVYGFRMHELTLEDSSLQGNRARQGGGMFIQSPPFTDATILQSVGRTNFTIRNCNILSNFADSGGGIWADDVISLSITDSNFESNVAEAFSGALHLITTQGYTTNTEPGVTSQVIQQNELRQQAMQSIGGTPDPATVNVVPVTTANLVNVTCSRNTASTAGGCLGALYGWLVLVEHSRFEDNLGEAFGAVYVIQSMFFCDWCQFINNTALDSGGAFLIQGISASAIANIAVAEAYLRNVLFLNNHAENYGGGLNIDGVDAALALVGNVTFDSNTARGGGAVSFWNGALMNITDTTFINNSALAGGGAVAISFIQFRHGSASFNNLRFIENYAPVGGAIHAQFNVHTSDQGVPRLEFDGTLIEPSLTIINTTFLRNNASEGGSLYFDGVPALLEKIILRENTASDHGGAMNIFGGSVVRMVEGSFLSNQALHGGGLDIRELAMLHCIDCTIEDNHADEDGGGVEVQAEPYENQPIAFQCDACNFNGNTASLGGGLHAGSPGSAEDDVFVVLRGAQFTNNTASIGGGAIMASHPTNVLFSCSYSPGDDSDMEERRASSLSIGFVLPDASHGLDPLVDGEPCASWSENEVAESGYGSVVASRVSYAVATYESLDSQGFSDRAVLMRNQSIPRLPPIYVTLYDEFEQAPAEARQDQRDVVVDLRANERAVELSGQLNVPFVRGEAVLDDVIVRGPPGNHILTLEFSDPEMESVSVEMEILSCPVGWESVAHNSACEICQDETYNFDPENRTCRDCPSNGRCRFWGIEPRRNYWQPFPCYDSPVECLSDESCDFAAREQELESFFEHTSPNCELSEEDLNEFRSVQCNKGWTGPLCGSCADGHGRRGSECRACFPKGLIVFLFLCALAWFLIVVGIGVRGNLSSTYKNSGADLEKRGWLHRMPQETSSNQEAPKSVQLSRVTAYQESRVTASQESRGTASQESRVTASRESTSAGSNSGTNGPSNSGIARVRMPGRKNLLAGPKRSPSKLHTSVEKDLAVRTIAEIFKLFVNFAQVNGMALSINSQWTEGMSAILHTLDSLGGVSGQAALSMDCLFSESSVPKSIGQEILFFMFPMMVLGIQVVYHNCRRRRTFEVRRRRMILSAVVVLYISYLGITRRLIRTLYCINITDGTSPNDTFEDTYWTEDTAVRCYTGSHGVLVAALVVPMLAIVSIAFPVFSAWVLIRRRQNGTLKELKSKETLGFMFRGYRDEYVFWDSIIMLRKAILALIVGFGYPLGVTLQGAIASLILFVSAQMQIWLCPVAGKYSRLNAAETLALTISAITFSAGVFLNDDKLTNGGRILIAVSVIFITLLFFVYCCGLLLINFIKLCSLDLEEVGVELETEKLGMIICKWVKFKFSKAVADIKSALTQRDPTSASTFSP